MANASIFSRKNGYEVYSRGPLLVTGVRDIRAGVRDIRAGVRDIRAGVRDIRAVVRDIGAGVRGVLVLGYEGISFWDTRVLVTETRVLVTGVRGY